MWDCNDTPALTVKREKVEKGTEDSITMSSPIAKASSPMTLVVPND